MIQISLPNTPTSWSAAIISKRGSYNPKGKKKTFTRWQIRSLFKDEMIKGFSVVEFIFTSRIPSSTSKKNRSLMLQGKIRPTRMDSTNCQKFYEDCIKNILIEDDRFVARIMSEKVYGERDEVLIKVWSLQEYEINNRVN